MGSRRVLGNDPFQRGAAERTPVTPPVPPPDGAAGAAPVGPPGPPAKGATAFGLTAEQAEALADALAYRRS